MHERVVVTGPPPVINSYLEALNRDYFSLFS